MTETLERHQEKLEERQTACLEQIQAMEKQVRALSWSQWS
jgi:phosphatidylinositol phospholipase C beta